jgi:competence protein ComEA
MKYMKYVVAGLAIVAAVAALFFRPPHGDSTIGAGPNASSSAPASPSPFARAARVRPSIPRRLVVYVAGEVLKPGVYALAPGARAQDALARAGGPKSDADLVAVNLAAPLEDGTEIAVPKIGEAAPRARRSTVPRTRAAHAPRGHGGRRRAAPQSPLAQSVDLNLADASELEALPGVGPALAARIVAYRETNGPFASVDELADISGITPRLQDELADFVVVR